MSKEQNAPVTQAEYRKWIAKRPSPRETARAGLRDRFATAALSGLLAEGSHPRELCAEEAYFHADAMMKARGHE